MLRGKIEYIDEPPPPDFFKEGQRVMVAQPAVITRAQRGMAEMYFVRFGDGREIPVPVERIRVMTEDDCRFRPVGVTGKMLAG